MGLSHINQAGEAQMVDISSKAIRHREAFAEEKIYLQPDTLQLMKKQLKKGQAKLACPNY